MISPALDHPVVNLILHLDHPRIFPDADMIPTDIRPPCGLLDSTLGSPKIFPDADMIPTDISQLDHLWFILFF
jgi:hypothetical protein